MNKLWVLPDRSNGASHLEWPSYIWVYLTRKAARERKELHRNTPAMYAKLGAIRHVSASTLYTLGYSDVGGIAAGHYWARRNV